MLRGATGPLAIGISFIAAGLAAANLLLDMDWIQKASYQRLPKWMEWYGAQSLMLTLVRHNSLQPALRGQLHCHVSSTMVLSSLNGHYVPVKSAP